MTPTPTPTSSPVPDTISFSPPVPSLNNPVALESAAPQAALTFTIGFTAYNAQGVPITPSTSNPLTIVIYGIPPTDSGTPVVSPSQQSITSGNSATFTYSGEAFPNNLTVEAWIYDPAAGIPAGEPGAVNGGYAIGVTQIVGQNQRTCSPYQTASYTIAPNSVPPDSFNIQAAVGYSASPTPAPSAFAGYTVDTGSMGVLTPATELPTPVPAPTAGGTVIGPGPSGVQFYDSSGNTFSGYYYLAPVTFQTTGGIVQTIPLEVLAVNKGYCSGDSTLSCWTNGPPKPTLHYMGVGFDREGLVAGSLFLSPAQNAFINLTDSSNGADISQGYDLSATSQGITLGLTDANTAGYNTLALTPSLTTAGEWNTMPGCFSFPQLSLIRYCGTLLLDVGIQEMFLNPSTTPTPAAASTIGPGGLEYVPAGTQMTVTVGTPGGSSPLSYTMEIPNSGPSPSATASPVGAAPLYAKWVSPGANFINTGRDPIILYNYFYDAQCGQVGFQQAP